MLCGPTFKLRVPLGHVLVVGLGHALHEVAAQLAAATKLLSGGGGGGGGGG